MGTQEEELALLGILEASLGDRQRAMNGLHLDQGTSLEVHREMLELAHQVGHQAADQTAQQTSHQTSHRRPGPTSRLLLAGRLRLAGALRRVGIDRGVESRGLRGEGS